MECERFETCLYRKRPVAPDHAEVSTSTEFSGYAIDKNGIPILPGDTLKVFHFTGARKRQHFMYKFVESVEGKRLVINHLGVGLTEKYTILNSGRYPDIEIVQGYAGVRSGNTFEDRERF